MKKFLIFLILLLILSCETKKKVEEISQKVPLIKLKISTKGLEREALWRQNLCIADIDMDGNLDIIAPPPRLENLPVIFLGDGQGNWREWTEVEFPNLSYSYGGVDVADLDKNGLPDIALACHSGRIFVLLQKEKGKFEDLSEGFPSPDKFSSKTIKFSDVDEDGIEEIIVISEGETRPAAINPKITKQKIFKLQGKKWEEIPVIFEKRAPPCFGNNVLVDDFDLDGKKDFITSCNYFEGKKIFFKNTENGFLPIEISSLPDSSYIFYLTKSDFDQDGRQDFAFTSLSFDKSEEAKERPETAVLARIFVAFNNADNWDIKEIIRHNSGKDMFHIRAISSGDLDGNGFDDIVAILDDGEPLLYLNKDGKNFQKANFDGFIKRGLSFWMDIKDVNKDGKKDIIVTYGSEKSGGKIDVYLNETN